MDSPPNLRMMDDDSTNACGNCKHYGIAGKYDPAASREGNGRRLHCTKYSVDVDAYQLCDDHQRKASAA